MSDSTVKATEATVQVGEPTLLIVRGEVRTLFASTVNAREFEDGVLRRLDAFKREEVRTTGRCEWRFNETGVGQIQAKVESTKAFFFLPATVEAQPVTKQKAVSESRPSLFERIFGRRLRTCSLRE